MKIEFEIPDDSPESLLKAMSHCIRSYVDAVLNPVSFGLTDNLPLTFIEHYKGKFSSEILKDVENNFNLMKSVYDQIKEMYEKGNAKEEDNKEEVKSDAS